MPGLARSRCYVRNVESWRECARRRGNKRRLLHITDRSTLIDELGYLAYDARAADLIFQLVSRRYEHRSLLITTNLPFKRWDTVFPNASCAVALIDRLTHHVEILLIDGARPTTGSETSSPVAAFAASMLTASRSARPTTARAVADVLGGLPTRSTFSPRARGGP